MRINSSNKFKISPIPNSFIEKCCNKTRYSEAEQNKTINLLQTFLLPNFQIKFSEKVKKLI